MNLHITEGLLRDTLRSEAEDAVPAGVSMPDPWIRVDRAYRRSRGRRRAGAAAVLAAAAAVSTGLLAAQPWQSPTQPADGHLESSTWSAPDLTRAGPPRPKITNCGWRLTRALCQTGSR